MSSLIIKPLALLILTTSLFGAKKDPLEDDPTIIETHGLDFYKQKRPPEIQQQCLTQELNAYSLWGDSPSLGDPNPLCPAIQGNCCGPLDQRRIKYIWERDRKFQEKHHKTVLKINRYILGFTREYSDIAKEILEAWDLVKMQGKQANNPRGAANNNNNDYASQKGLPYSLQPSKFCAKHAKRVLESGLIDRRKVEAFYHDLTSKVEFMENTRRGFYCSLCAAEAQEHFGTHWKIFDWIYADRIYYDKSFCELIHEWSFRTIYTMWKSYRPFVSSIMKMLICVLPKGQANNRAGNQRNNAPGRPQLNVNVDIKIDLNFNANLGLDPNLLNPLANVTKEVRKLFDEPIISNHRFKMELCDGAVPGDFFFFTRCELFCQKWNIAKPVSLFDGSIKKSKRVFDYLVQYEFAFMDRTQNHFRDKIADLKKMIHDNYEERAFKPFYTSIAIHIKLDKYKSDFLAWWRGLHPMELAEGSPLEFEYKWAGLARALLCLLTLFFAF